MTRLAIFSYFLIMVTVALRLHDFLSIIFLVAAFVFFYNWAEQLDEGK